MSGTDIFLSYARSDRAAARMFADAFTSEGFRVWWDASLHSGETFDEVIERHLREAKAVVVLWSPRSVASRWVRAEATQADRKNKLVPAIIEPCDRPIIFELTHAAELSDWTGDTTDMRWQSFVVDLRRLVDAAVADPEQRGGTNAPSTNRPPLRPGHDQVIIAGGSARAPQGQRATLTAVPSPADDLPQDVHCLEIEDDKLGKELFVVDSSGVKIGRTAPADIVISHRSVSREHCIIGIANDELLVSDLNSTNGTYIDGQRIARATVLPVGSILALGEVTLRHSVYSHAEAQRSNDGRRGGRLAAAS